jgi:HipA-like C-terminal domain
MQMRKRTRAARDQLALTLGRQPRATAAELAASLQVSVATLHRMLAELPPEHLLAAGRSRRARYALRRSLRGDYGDLPLYAIDAAGQATTVTKLALVQPQGTLMGLPDAIWPLPPEARDGWWDGLPYPLCDMRPQGYLGRKLARAEHEQLGVSPNPEEWSDDDIVFVLSRVGTDASGNLLLGDAAYRRWIRGKLAPAQPVPESELGEHYAKRAEEALVAGLAASSAGGEFPKFTAIRQAGLRTPHVVVKFSGAGESAAERRWADLLVCEHLALECCGTLPGVASARTRVVEHAGRVFLEAERFDREAMHGRLPVCTLDALNGAFLGAGTSDWTRLVAQLQQRALLQIGVVEAVDLLWWFGRLVANTDMHLGNLSFRVAPKLRLAPAYDMLPMAYAPLPGGEVPPQDFNPPPPLPAQRAAWQTAAAAALAFWRRASTHERVSALFRALCAANADALEQVAARV